MRRLALDIIVITALTWLLFGICSWLIHKTPYYIGVLGFILAWLIGFFLWCFVLECVIFWCRKLEGKR